MITLNWRRHCDLGDDSYPYGAQQLALGAEAAAAKSASKFGKNTLIRERK